MSSSDSKSGSNNSISHDVPNAVCLGIATKAIHLGQDEVGVNQFPVPPLVCNSAILLNSVEEGREMLGNDEVENFAYQRYANPTVSILEKKFRALEECEYCLAVNSGMTACLLVFRAFLKQGDHVIVPHSIFNEVIDQLDYEIKNRGIEVSILKEYSINTFEVEVRANTKMVFVEAPTNSAFLDINILELGELCKKKDIMLVVDNTFLTPVCQKPLSLGADITVYSITKHINGHGDVVGGIVSANDSKIHEALKYNRGSAGLILDPFSAWLTIRGMRTLHLRLMKHSENARLIIQMMSDEFSTLECRSVWSTRSAKANGVTSSLNTGLIAIVFSSAELGSCFVRNLRLIKMGTTFGSVESLCYHYGSFTRRDVSELEEIGVPAGLVRVSVGLEDIQDIKEDIRRALKVVMELEVTLGAAASNRLW